MDLFIGEIKLLPWDWAPKGWALCFGQQMQVAQYQTLFSLLGTQFGGNGIQTFNLPDMRGRTPVSSPTPTLGAAIGTETVSLTVPTMPGHIHGFTATSATASANSASGNIVGTDAQGTIDFLAAGPATPFPINTGTIAPNIGGTAHNNMQPYLVMNYCIALVGIYPSRN